MQISKEDLEIMAKEAEELRSQLNKTDKMIPDMEKTPLSQYSTTQLKEEIRRRKKDR